MPLQPETDLERALAAITAVRHRAAASFDEGFTGVRGQAYDRAVLDCYDAVKALASVPEQTLQAEAIDIVRRFIRATDDKGHLNVPAIHAAQDRARALFAKLSPKAPSEPRS